MKFHRGLFDSIPALVQIMACCRPGDKLLSEPMMVSLLTHICVTRPVLWLFWIIKAWDLDGYNYVLKSKHNYVQYWTSKFCHEQHQMLRWTYTSVHIWRRIVRFVIWLLTCWISRKHKNTFVFYIITGRSHGTGTWNPSTGETGSCTFRIVNATAIDGLATQEPGHHQPCYWCTSFQVIRNLHHTTVTS